jgi:hypothetical protein
VWKGEGLMGRRLVGAALGVILSAALWPGSARAQAVVMPPLEIPGFKEAPGYYGMSFGYPSFGSVRTYSEFSSPYGGGYGYGYRPAAILPGAYGAGIWRPGSTWPGYQYGAATYRTFAIPYQRNPPYPVVTPPVGVYAPAFGPRTIYGW